MVKITRVYTKTGDQGETSLAGGVRISKVEVRIETIGTIDELNSLLGLSVVGMVEAPHDFSIFIQQLQRIQNELFDLGASLSIVNKDIAYLTESQVAALEHEIDEMNRPLPVLHSFILPGGSKISAELQVARSVCRRAERRLVTLAQAASVEKYAIPYLNRLSDWLFVAARVVNFKLAFDEPLWKPRHSS